MQNNVFPENFLWGAASAAAQVEGAYDIDGRTPSIWDIAPAGKIKNGDSCHDGCDHYHHYQDDVEMMKEMGLKSYRFSISWSRVIPQEGIVNPKGIQFYSNLVGALKMAGIEPIVTLYHWDLPVWVHEKGGWRSEEIISYFAEYTRIVVEALSDRVKWWIPMNEPQCFVPLGYQYGIHAPFRRNFYSLSRVTRICMLAHAASVRTIRKYAKQPSKIGIAMAAGAYIPEKESPEAVEKAQRMTFYSGAGLFNNRWWSDPLLAGKPVSAYGIFRTRKRDMEGIFEPLDFIGVNVYQPFGAGSQTNVPEDRKTSMGWLIDGRVLYWTIRFFYERYHLPVIVTENGMAGNDVMDACGKVNDVKRIGFLKEYLANLKRAVSEGIPVLGYQHWSVMDNFEWAEGYGPRFGLAYVDYSTKERVLKESALEYRRIICSNGACLE